MMYTIPPHRDNDSVSSCEYILTNEQFTQLPFVQVQSEIDDIFIYWKYGQGSQLSKPFYDGVVTYWPFAGGLYTHIIGMIRVFDSNNETKVSEYLEAHKDILKEKTLSDRLWLPELYTYECLPRTLP